MDQSLKNERMAPRASRAWYGATVADFLRAEADTILGALSRNSDFTVMQDQVSAWNEQTRLLQSCLQGLTGNIYYEFVIPRMGRRIDVALQIGPVVFVIEFKVGSKDFDRYALDQTWDYALDLKNFHEGSHKASIVPILVATEAKASPANPISMDNDKVYRPIPTAPSHLRAIIDQIITIHSGAALEAEHWAQSPYRPTPTILEAARTLYANHSVQDIARYDAGAQNLNITSNRIEDILEEARAQRNKTICFVTGVPGAGKTLVGLNIATRRDDVSEPTHATFLSGNGPLVKVLQEALTRDEYARQKRNGIKVRKNKIGESVKAFIQNVHHFRDEALVDVGAPSDHVAIFDEAQRAWNREHTARFMQTKKKRPGFRQSEPEFLLSYMDRHADWAMVVCLVGGGQEINTGEAGIEAWLDAVNHAFPDWHVHISSQLTDSEYAAGHAIDQIRQRPHVHFDDHLHLSVSMRSFRAENVSAFVKALLDCEQGRASVIYQQFRDSYPMAVTRDLDRAKAWIRARARGTERYGMVASSRAQRLKPHAIDVRVAVDPVVWFLNGKNDTRSSYYLEDAATEYRVQGLELDWACVTWDGDLRYRDSFWGYHAFRGSRWNHVHKPDIQRYLRNAYRVLLTRARQGMVIFVPPGDPQDPTRCPSFYDTTYAYLAGVGIPEV